MGRVSRAFTRLPWQDFIVVAGIAFIAFGAWLLAEWLGFIVLGVLLIASVVYGSRT